MELRGLVIRPGPDSVAAEVDLRIHDAQYSVEAYPQHIGWGHSSLQHALAFATFTGVKHLVPFHHDPTHTDADLDRLLAAAVPLAQPSCAVTPGAEGTTFTLSASTAHGGAAGRS